MLRRVSGEASPEILLTSASSVVANFLNPTAQSRYSADVKQLCIKMYRWRDGTARN